MIFTGVSPSTFLYELRYLLPRNQYQFVPAQRWLHNIEHGAVVMLYHPCTHPHTVQTLRRLVTGCIRKHIITPHTNMPEDRPLALVAWGCRMLMSEVDENQVITFIREKGLKGPEVGQWGEVCSNLIMIFITRDDFLLLLPYDIKTAKF